MPSVHAKEQHHGASVMDQVLAYALRATKGLEFLEFTQYLDAAREIRGMYEEAIADISTSYALHPAHPLPEIEVVTGAVLGSIFNRRLKDLAAEMKDRSAIEISGPKGWDRKSKSIDQKKSREQGSPEISIGEENIPSDILLMITGPVFERNHDRNVHYTIRSHLHRLSRRKNLDGVTKKPFWVLALPSILLNLVGKRPSSAIL